VTATSARSAWAVGSVILRWNGRAWTQVRSNFPPLSGVAAASARNAWAVGFTQPSRDVVKILILHWNGTTWKTVTNPPTRPR
jgi:hypothetical protein